MLFGAPGSVYHLRVSVASLTAAKPLLLGNSDALIFNVSLDDCGCAAVASRYSVVVMTEVAALSLAHLLRVVASPSPALAQPLLAPAESGFWWHAAGTCSSMNRVHASARALAGP